MEKSQSSIEFLIVTGIVFLVLTVFFVSVYVNVEEQNQKKEKIILTNIVLSVQDEINLASESSDGYVRKFKIPGNILGKDYSIIINNNSIYANTTHNALSLRTKEIEGQIKKGENIIRKENGKIYLN